MMRRIFLVSIVLLLSFSLRMWVNAAPPPNPKRESLATFPKQLDSWKMVGEAELSDSIAGVLRADDYVLRSYMNDKGQQVDFFAAYYKTQKAGESMHSPKNCLPGWGWQILKMDYVPLYPENAQNPTLVNRYVIEKDNEKSIVLYWYQANGRVIASEYWGKIYLVTDALRTGRRDGSIVRFVVSVAKNSNGDAELQSALTMARNTAPLLPRYLPD
jgi:EpsI family protein